MSKIANDDLTRSGTECFIAVPIWQQWMSKGNYQLNSCTICGAKLLLLMYENRPIINQLGIFCAETLIYRYLFVTRVSLLTVQDSLFVAMEDSFGGFLMAVPAFKSPARNGTGTGFGRCQICFYD